MIAMDLLADELLSPAPTRPVAVTVLPSGRRKGDRLLYPVDPCARKVADARFRGTGRNRASLDLRQALLAHYVERGK